MNEILEKQKEFQRLVGFPIDSIRESDRNEMAEKYIFKAIEELIEVRKEFPSTMNPWSKKQKPSDRTRVREEFTDVLLFLANLMIVWKFTPDEMLKSLTDVQNNNFNNYKTKKMNILNSEILSIPSYTCGIGQGNLKPKFIFIGQNPGSDIKKGYKFWSNPEDGSSKVLLPVLESLGIIQDCYFTNIVKSTTPDNSEPSESLTTYWNEYLKRELDILKTNNPDAKVITMGKWTEKNFNGASIHIAHPASVFYGHLAKEEYGEEIKKATE